jgi:hypothetical protein
VNKRILIASILVLMVAGAAFAQLPPGKWWRQPNLVSTLQLSEDQQNKLEGIFRTSANELIDMKGEVEKATIALRGELDQAQLNRQNIQKAAAKLNDARGRLFSRELNMLADMRGVLTDAQWNRMRNDLDHLGKGPGPQARPGQGRGGMQHGGMMPGREGMPPRPGDQRRGGPPATTPPPQP